MIDVLVILKTMFIPLVVGFAVVVTTLEAWNYVKCFCNSPESWTHVKAILKAVIVIVVIWFIGWAICILWNALNIGI